MTIATELIEHINGRAEKKAVDHAQKAVAALSAEVQKGEITVTSPTGGTLSITPTVVESIQASLLSGCRERFQKEEVELFVKDANALIEERAKKSGK